MKEKIRQFIAEKNNPKNRATVYTVAGAIALIIIIIWIT